ncbi:MAG: hypothetical protein Alpg2KO_16850 [Alphaproteobacteria bacterium]
MVGTSLNLPAYTLYTAYEAQADKRLDAFKKSPEIAREVEYFQERMAEIETVEEFIDDRRLLQFALSAHAMDGEEQYPARVKAILTEDSSDNASLVNRMTDPRFKEIAEFFEFHGRDLNKIKLSTNQEKLIDKFITNEYEKSMGEENPALRQIAYFKRKIADMTDMFEVLGDKILREVVQTTFDIPQQVVFQSVDKQKEVFEARISIEDLTDPAGLEKFAQRFLIKSDANAQANGGFAAGGGGGWQTQLFAQSASGNAASGLFNLLI